MRSNLPLFLCCICSFALAAQNINIEGDAAEAANGRPVANVHVVVSAWTDSQRVAAQTVDTDANGHFQVSLPPPAASYEVEASKPGYRGQSFWVSLRPGEDSRHVRIMLMPTPVRAMISGRVEDQDGFPAEGARVEALRWEFIRDRRKLQIRGSGYVNDLGAYRILIAHAGSYYLRVVPSGRLAQSDPRYAPEFYGGTVEPRDNAVVKVESGVNRDGIDFRLTRREGVVISGHLILPDGAAPPPDTTRFQIAPIDYPFAAPRTVTPDPRDGSFVFRHVWPGQWTLRFVRNGPALLGAGDLYAERTLQVGATDLRDIVVAAKVAAAQDVSGTIVFEGGATPRNVMIGLRGSGPGNSEVKSARSNDDGSFTVRGLLPGHYTVEVTPTADDALARVHIGFPRSAVLGGAEVSQLGFDLDGTPAGSLRIALTMAVGEIDGTLTDGGRTAADVPLLLVGSWCQLRAITNDSGGFHFAHLYPGDYRVVPLTASSYEAVTESDFIPPEVADYPPVHVIEGTNRVAVSWR